MAAILCINTKFTGLVYLVFVFAAGGLWCLLRRRQWILAYCGWAVLALLLGALVFGYNPYVTNTIYRRQPFYPILGSTDFPVKISPLGDVNERWETPKNMAGRGRLVHFLYAIFGRPGNQPYPSATNGKPELNAQLMWPFTARPADLHYYNYQETRVAGFGPFFSGALLISLALAAWLLIQSKSSRLALMLTALTIVASLQISIDLWWPRLGPQLWLLPILPAIFVFWNARSSRMMMGTASLLTLLLLVNALIVAGVHLTWETKSSLKLRQQLTQMRQSGKEIEICFNKFTRSGEERLKAWGIPYHEISLKEIQNGIELMSVVEGYPRAVQFQLPNANPNQ
jgi:hypothetical protein